MLSGGRIDEVGRDHRIERESPGTDARAQKHHRIVLDVLPALGNRRILQNRTEFFENPVPVEIGALPMSHGNIVRSERLRGQRDPHDLRAHRVNIRGLHVNADHRPVCDLREQLIQHILSRDGLVHDLNLLLLRGDLLKEPVEFQFLEKLGQRARIEPLHRHRVQI